MSLIIASIAPVFSIVTPRLQFYERQIANDLRHAPVNRLARRIEPRSAGGGWKSAVGKRERETETGRDPFDSAPTWQSGKVKRRPRERERGSQNARTLHLPRYGHFCRTTRLTIEEPRLENTGHSIRIWRRRRSRLATAAPRLEMRAARCTVALPRLLLASINLDQPASHEWVELIRLFLRARPTRKKLSFDSDAHRRSLSPFESAESGSLKEAFLIVKNIDWRGHLKSRSSSKFKWHFNDALSPKIEQPMRTLLYLQFFQ